ncbi:MAG TPA: GntG family PLP-dependent aldolase [Burkholderiales bacterium]|nr:GntG family PLP-dependent aldolase [Burkholderiales bacterium]
MALIDLRSDTVTHPTEAMLEAMRNAELGDDGREGDPTVRRLEALAAERTGKQAALYLPSGTQANLIALLSHTGRGSEVLLHEGAHIISYENYGLSLLGSLFYRPIPGRRGAMDVAALENALGSGLSAKGLAPSLVCMETTHNNASGAVLPLEHMAAVYKLARRHGANVHTDGARLFNAAVALGVPAERIAQHTDTICFCVSKGLSAPVGSLLCGPAELIARARHFRRMTGGSMRQSGLLAAAGIVALQTMVERLAEDHRSARQLAAGLQRIDASLVDAGEIETNIVRVEVSASRVPAAQWSADLKALGVWAGDYGASQLRFVTHRHIGAQQVEAAIAAVGTLWQRYAASAVTRSAA